MTLPPAKPASLDPSPRGRPAWWAFVVLALAIAFAVITGPIGFGRSEGGADQKDFAWMWAAGSCWLDGNNPYDYDAVLKPVLAPLVGAPNAFAYAPQSAPLCMAIALVPLSAAKVLMTSLNGLSLVALAAFVCCTLRCPPRRFIAATPFSPTVSLLMAALVVGSPMTSHTLAMGQSSLLAAAAIAWGWRLAYTGRPYVAGVLIAVASIKPPFVLLPVLWLLLDRQWRTMLSFALVCAICAAYPLLLTGPMTVEKTWLASMHQYKTAMPNLIGFEHNMGLPNLLFALGIRVPDLTAVACAGTVALYLFLFAIGRRLDALIVLGLLAVMYLGFGVSHDYDMLMLVPTLVAMTFLVRGSTIAISCAWLIVVLLQLPQRLVRLADIPWLLHWRTAVVVVLLVWMVGLALRGAQSRTTTPADA